MSQGGSNFDARPVVQDDDCDITDEYDNIVEGVSDMKRKLVLLATQARKLKSELLAKDAEIIRLNTRHQQELSHHQRSAKDLRKTIQAQGNRLKQNKENIALFRRRITQITKDLEGEREKLGQVDFLRCDICQDKIKNIVTGCSHGFYRGCIDKWLHRRADPNTDRTEKSCPDCRRILIKGEIRPVFLGSDTRPPAFLGRNGTTVLLTVDSDDE
jgi:hypothetical protein